MHSERASRKEFRCEWRAHSRWLTFDGENGSGNEKKGAELPAGAPDGGSSSVIACPGPRRPDTERHLAARQVDALLLELPRGCARALAAGTERSQDGPKATGPIQTCS